MPLTWRRKKQNISQSILNEHLGRKPLIQRTDSFECSGNTMVWLYKLSYCDFKAYYLLFVTVKMVKINQIEIPKVERRHKTVWTSTWYCKNPHIRTLILRTCLYKPLRFFIYINFT